MSEDKEREGLVMKESELMELPAGTAFEMRKPGATRPAWTGSSPSTAR